MPINTDIRQAIILALETQGEGVIAQLNAALLELQERLGVLATAYGEGTVEGDKFIAMSAKNLETQRKLQSQIEMTKQEIDGFTASAANTLIPLEKLIVTGLKYQDVLDKINAKSQASDNREQQLKEESELQEYLGRKTREAAEESARAHQASIDARVRGTQAVRDEIEAIEAARVADIKAMGDRAQAYARAERAAQEASAAAKQADGEAKRSRIDAYAAWDEAVDRNAAKRKRVEGDVAQALGDSKRQRIEDLAREERQTDKWVQSMRRLNPEFDMASQGANKYGYALLNVSHAMQDAQYGFSALLNNIPLITQSIVQAVPAFDKWAAGVGGAAGVAGAFMVAGVAIEALLSSETFQNNIHKIGREFDLIGDPIRDATSGLQGMKEVIQGINDKPLKVQADYDAMRKLTEEVKAAEQAMSEWEAMKNKKTSTQEAMQKSVSEGITESGAGKALEEVLIERHRKHAMAPGSELHGKIANEQATIDFYKQITDRFGVTGMIGGSATIRIQAAQAEINRLKNQMEDESRQKIAEMITLKSGEGSRQSLEDTIKNPEIAAALEARGVDLDRLRAGVENAAPKQVHEAERRKIRLEREKAEAEAKDAMLEHEIEANLLTGPERGRQWKADRRKEAAAAKQADKEGAWQVHQDQRLKREQEADAKRQAAAEAKALDAANNPALLERQRAASYGQEFQSRARKIGVGVGGNDAQAAGKDIAKAVANGADVDTAMQMALNKLASYFQRSQMSQLRQQAAWEQMNNMVGQATVQLNMIEMRQQQQRMRRPTRGRQ